MRKQRGISANFQLSPVPLSLPFVKILFFLFQDTGFPLFIFETWVSYTILQGIPIFLYLSLRWLVFFQRKALCNKDGGERGSTAATPA
jgi:hypothetical protein